MYTKPGIKILGSWFAAGFILPNFLTTNEASFDLITSFLSGTLLLVITYYFEDLYGKYQ